MWVCARCVRSPVAGVIGIYDLPLWLVGVESRSSERQHAFFTTEPPLQPVDWPLRAPVCTCTYININKMNLFLILNIPTQ